jgi:hypothetical protein
MSVRPANSARAIRLTLAATGFFFLFAYRTLGLSLIDDTTSISLSTQLHRSNFLYQQDWSPLYSAWLLALSHVVHSPYARYYTSWALLAGFLALLPTVLRVSRAWLYTLAVLVVPVLIVNPFSGLFAACFVLTGLCIVLRWERSLAMAAFTVCVASFCISYARPEFNYAVFLACLVAAILFAVEYLPSRNGATRRTKPAVASLCMALLVLLALTNRNVMHHSVSPRSGLAFAEHFNIRAFEHNEQPPVPGFVDSDFAAKQFGITLDSRGYNALTIQDFARHNPRLFARHILRNLFDPRVLILILLWALALSVPWFRASQRRLRPASIYLLLICLPSFAGMLLIYPREHYAAVLLPSLLLFAAQFTSNRDWSVPPIWLGTLVLIPVMAFVYLVAAPRMFFALRGEQLDRAQTDCVRRAEETLPAGGSVFDGLGYGGYSGSLYFKPHTMETIVQLPNWPAMQTWTQAQHPVWIATGAPTESTYNVPSATMENYFVHTLGYRPFACPANAKMHIYTRP